MALTSKKKNYPANLDSFIEQKPVSGGAEQAFSVKLSLDLHKEVKQFALANDMSLKELFLEMYSFYRKNK